MESLDEYQISNCVVGEEGDLWFSHRGGLLHYDGLELVDYAFDEEVADRVVHITKSSDGRIFMVAGDHLMIFENGEFSKFPSITGRFFSRNVKLAEYVGGRMIAGTQTGLYEINGYDLKPLRSDLKRVGSMLMDSEKRLWTWEWDSSKIKVFDLVENDGALTLTLKREYDRDNAQPFPPVFYLDSLDRVWVIDPNTEDRVYCYVDYERAESIEGLARRGLFEGNIAVAEGSEGDLWFWVKRRAGRYFKGDWEVYDIEDVPIPSSAPYLVFLEGKRLLVGGHHLTPHIIDLSERRWKRYYDLNFQFEDGEGAKWFLTVDRKVVSLLEGNWRSHSGDGLIDTANRLLLGSDGSVWASGSHGGEAAVSLLKGGRWERFEYPDVGNTFSHVGAIETRDGQFIFGGGSPENWENSLGGAVVFQSRGESFSGRHFPPPTFPARPANIVERESEGLLFGAGSVLRGFSNDVFSAKPLGLFSNQWIDHMIVDGNDDLWVACMGVGIYRVNGSETELFDRNEGLDTKDVIQLLEGRSGEGVYVLTDEGFFRYDGSRWGRFGFEFDLPLRRENHTLFSDGEGAIWVNFTSRPWLLDRKAFAEGDYRFQTLRYIPESFPPETYAWVSSNRYPEGGQIQVHFDGVDFFDHTPRRDLVYSWSEDGETWSEYTDAPGLTLSGDQSGDRLIWVRSRDLAGNVDSSPAEVRFAVVPPVWKRAWFIAATLITVLVIAILISTIFKYRVRAALAIEEFKLDFFTNISHELRNPLAVIISPVELLLESGVDANVRDKLRLVLRNARRMQGMVDQLLQFRKLEKGKWSISPSGGELIGFIREEVQNFEPLWEEKNQRLEMRLSPDSHLCSFDVSIVQKVVDNLVSNAIKYSGKGSKIMVASRIESLGGQEELVLTVEDEGVGIPLHEQENVLKPFYRIKRKGEQAGSGVGLALVNQLVSLSGGTVSIASPPEGKGTGTRFDVRMPVDAYFENEDLWMEDEGDSLEREGKPALLFVEDNEDLRKVVSEFLGQEFHVFEEGDGLSGLERAKALNPDIIISDVMMPEMDGLEMCERLKSDTATSHIPIILLTAKSTSEHRIEGIKLGADAYIGKPLDMNHLKVRLDNLLESRRELKRKFAQQLMVEPSEVTVTPADELMLRKAIEIVEENMQDPDFHVDRFGELMGMSRSTLKRKLKAVTGQTPQPFVQKMRLKRAANLLKNEGVTVSEVAEIVGIYDISYFGKVFKKEFGVAPSAYRGSLIEKT